MLNETLIRSVSRIDIKLVTRAHPLAACTLYGQRGWARIVVYNSFATGKLPPHSPEWDMSYVGPLTTPIDNDFRVMRLARKLAKEIDTVFRPTLIGGRDE